MNRLCLRLLLAALSSVSLLVVLELGLRVYDYANGKGFFWDDSRNPLSRQYRPVVPFRTFGPELYGTERGRRVIKTSHGEVYPFDKPAGTTRIVCLGGSTTFNTAEGLHYPRVVQDLLRRRVGRESIEVLNEGYPSYATPHLLILLELDVVAWHPDVVIITENVNDLTASYFPHFTFDYSNKYSDPFYAGPDYQSLYPPMNVVFRHSKLYWFLLTRWQAYQTKADLTRRIRRRSYGVTPDREASAVFERNLRTLVAVARLNDITPVLATQPLEPSEEYFQRFEDFKPYNGAAIYPLHEEFVAHHTAYNAIIRRVATDTGTLCIDNAAALGGRREYLADVVHYTRAGIERLSANVAETLVANHVVQ